jgi:hypothetical protein
MSSVYLKPTKPLAGVVQALEFPFTPTIEYGHDVKYDNYSLTHTNYQPYAYARSENPTISLTARFSAHTTDHFIQSEYALRFLRSYTKMNYGRKDPQRGQPPRILRFYAYGTQLFENVPVLINKFSMTFPEDVDYIRGIYDAKGNLVSEPIKVRDPGVASNTLQNQTAGLTMKQPAADGTTDMGTIEVTGQRINEVPMYLPALFQINISLLVQQDSYNTVLDFNLDDFSKGALSKEGYI